MLTALERALWLLGGALTAIAMLAWWDAYSFQQRARSSLVRTIPGSWSEPDANPSRALRLRHLPRTSRAADVSDWSEGRKQAHAESGPIDQHGVLAWLEIPAIDLEVAVVPGTGALALNRAVGHVEGTAAPGSSGNVALAAHRDGFFRRLGKLEPGDAVWLQLATSRHLYRVDGHRVVLPDEVDVLEERDSPTLTLVTCYPFYYVGSAPLRYVVSATRVRVEPFELRTAQAYAGRE